MRITIETDIQRKLTEDELERLSIGVWKRLEGLGVVGFSMTLDEGEIQEIEDSLECIKSEYRDEALHRMQWVYTMRKRNERIGQLVVVRQGESG